VSILVGRRVCLRLLSIRLLTPMHVKHTILNKNYLPEDKSKKFETYKRQQKFTYLLTYLLAYLPHGTESFLRS